MNQKEWTEFCLTLPGAYEDYPFGEDWAVMRHKANNKTFAMFYEREGRLCVNLKCEPLRGEFWRKLYSAVTPGYHMNKTHWNTVILDGSIEQSVIEGMICDSYDLIKPKQKKRTPKKIFDKF